MVMRSPQVCVSGKRPIPYIWYVARCQHHVCSIAWYFWAADIKWTIRMKTHCLVYISVLRHMLYTPIWTKQRPCVAYSLYCLHRWCFDRSATTDHETAGMFHVGWNTQPGALLPTWISIKAIRWIIYPCHSFNWIMIVKAPRFTRSLDDFGITYIVFFMTWNMSS